jgi:hypothetical protein
MGKYAALESFLAERGWSEVPMTFDDIERVVGNPLPPRASKHRAWWSNSPTNNVMTQAWLNAGYKTERVDMANRKLTFVRASGGKTRTKAPPPSTPSTGILARIDELLGGSVTIPEGVDIIAPTGEAWDAER